MSSVKVEGRVGCSVSFFLKRSIIVSASCGRRPVSISNRVTPTA